MIEQAGYNHGSSCEPLHVKFDVSIAMPNIRKKKKDRDWLSSCLRIYKKKKQTVLPSQDSSLYVDVVHQQVHQMLFDVAMDVYRLKIVSILTKLGSKHEINYLY